MFFNLVLAKRMDIQESLPIGNDTMSVLKRGLGIKERQMS